MQIQLFLRPTMVLLILLLFTPCQTYRKQQQIIIRYHTLLTQTFASFRKYTMSFNSDKCIYFTVQERCFITLIKLYGGYFFERHKLSIKPPGLQRVCHYCRLVLLGCFWDTLALTQALSSMAEISSSNHIVIRTQQTTIESGGGGGIGGVLCSIATLLQKVIPVFVNSNNEQFQSIPKGLICLILTIA